MTPIFYESIKSIPPSNYNLKKPYIQSQDSKVLDDILFNFFLESAKNINDSHNPQNLVIINTTRRRKNINNQTINNQTMKNKCKH